MAPMTADHKWGGNISMSAGTITRITIIDDVTATPPSRDRIRINEDIDTADLVGLNIFSIEATLNLYRAVELYADGSIAGVKWQYLNPDSKKYDFVSTVQLGTGIYSQSSHETHDSANYNSSSEINATQAGISLGYRTNDYLVPYLSYIYESYKVNTKLETSTANFGPYKDNGYHQILGLGLMNFSGKFHWGIEVSQVVINWDRSNQKEQGATSFQLGYSW